MTTGNETNEETTKTRRRKTAKVDAAKAAEWQSAQTEADAAALESAKDLQQAAMPPRRFEEMLPCALTDAEMIARGEQLSAALSVVDDIASERKKANDGFKARTELQMERVRELQKAIDTKAEERSVECIESFELRLGCARTVRVDTGEYIRERALRSSELQPELPMTNGENGHAAQMNLGEADPTDISDAASLLAGAQRGEEPTPSNVTLDNDGGDEDEAR